MLSRFSRSLRGRKLSDLAQERFESVHFRDAAIAQQLQNTTSKPSSTVAPCWKPKGLQIKSSMLSRRSDAWRRTWALDHR